MGQTGRVDPKQYVPEVFGKYLACHFNQIFVSCFCSPNWPVSEKTSSKPTHLKWVKMSLLFHLLLLKEVSHNWSRVLSVIVKKTVAYYFQVLETNRNEESHNHVHRMYFLGSNTFSEPWHLPHSPSEQVAKIVYAYCLWLYWL